MSTNKIDLHAYTFATPKYDVPSKLISQYGNMGGEANGYIVCHKSHPWFGMPYEEVPVSVHGGLTFGRSCAETGFPIDINLQTEDYWIYGWDTMHFSDNSTNWCSKNVEKENDELYSQFYMATIKKMRDDNRITSGESI